TPRARIVSKTFPSLTEGLTSRRSADASAEKSASIEGREKMSTVRKLMVFVAVVVCAVAMDRFWLNAIQPNVSARLAIHQLNGSDDAFRQLRLFEVYKGAGDI